MHRCRSVKVEAGGGGVSGNTVNMLGSRPHRGFRLWDRLADSSTSNTQKEKKTNKRE